MGHPDGAHTHGSGGSGLAVALTVGAVVLAVAVAGPVLAAVAELVRLVVAIVITVTAVAALAGAALTVYRLRNRAAVAAPAGRVNHTRATLLPPAARPAESVTGPQPRAIGAPKQELHLHFHGVDAEDVAAIIARQQDRAGD